MPHPSPRVLTPTALAAHLACPHRTHLQRAIDEHRLRIPLHPDPNREALIQRGELHEAAFVASLSAEGLRVIDLRGRDVEATRAAMRAGHDVLVQAAIESARFRGIADVLRRADGGARTPHYEPWDTKLGNETKAGTLLQLACYAEMLGAMQEREPEHVHVVTPRGPETYRTAEIDAYARSVAQRLHAAWSDPPAAEACPDPVPHCEVCAFFAHCDRRRRDADHLTFVAGLGTLHVRELHRQGITTLLDFGRRQGELPTTPQHGHQDTYRRLGKQAALQVEARTTGTIPIEALAIAPHRGFCRLPEPSAGDVFLDFEGDPFARDGGREYLTGWITADTGYTARWSFTDDEERTALVAFLDFVAARWQRIPDLHVYHFSAYEPARLKRLTQRHGTHGDLLDRLLRGERFVDLCAVVREGLRIGIESYGLKPLEALTGFERRFDLRAAAAARRRLELHLEVGDLAAIDGDTRALVAAYNEEDCRSTEALRAWLEERRAEAIAGGQDVPRPAPKPDAAPLEVKGREARIAGLAQALRAGLPVAAAEEEQTGRALLADLLAYFVREEKCAWWEHFRLRELEAHELHAEREVLTGLRHFRRDEPSGLERMPTDHYCFPPQNCAITDEEVFVHRADDPEAEGIGTQLGTVVKIDLNEGTVAIKKTAKTIDLHPATVFRRQHIDCRALEKSLLAFAEAALEHGLDAPSATADLLRRRPPRLRVPARGALQRGDEAARDAVVRLCAELDGGVLPVQGPPGSGKTVAGAHAIVALARAGRRIGVTAVSHSVIDNLLGKARELAGEGGALRFVHKHDGTPPAGIEYRAQPKPALAAVRDGAIVGGTAWLWAHEEAAGLLDYLFVDEAGQMSLAQVLAASRSAKNLVLLGDPQQLEQPQRGAHPDGAEIAALVHVAGKEPTLAADRGVFLADTYRLHPAICEMTSELYYEGRLRAAPGCERQALRGDTPFAGAGLFCVDVEHEGNRADAPEEVAAVADVVRALLRPLVTWVHREHGERPLTARDILVVAPYNAQVSALRYGLAAFGVDDVGTVDRFQGREAAVVIYSCATSSVHDAPRGMDFLYDPHRFNVATSRARCAVIVVASPRLFAPECRTAEQVHMANGFCRFRELARPITPGARGALCS